MPMSITDLFGIGCAKGRKSLAQKVLLLGGTGLLGRPLLFELGAYNFRVTLVSSRPREVLHPLVDEVMKKHHMEYVQADLSQEENMATMQALIANHDALINLVADRGGVRSDGRRMAMNNAPLNTDLPLTLANFAEAARTPLLQLSTEYVWSGAGNTDEGYPAVSILEGDERFAAAGGRPYAVQKCDMERKIAEFNNVYILRVPVLYGEMLHKEEDGSASQSINNWLGENDWKHDIWQRRYPTSARDVAYTIAALTAKLIEPESEDGLLKTAAKKAIELAYGEAVLCHAFHYGAQQSVSKADFMKLVQQAAGLEANPVNVENLEDRPPEQRPPFDVKLSNNALRAYLGFSYRTPSALSVDVVKETWLKHFEEELAAARARFAPNPNEAEGHTVDGVPVA